MFAGWLDNLNPKKWVDYIIKGCYRAIKRFICWMVLEALGWSSQFVNFLLSYVPEPPDYISDLLGWFGLINAWVPVDTFLWCAFTYYSVCAAIAGVRFVKSWLPTVSG